MPRCCILHCSNRSENNTILKDGVSYHRRARSNAEKELFRSLSQNFLPEIPRIFQEKKKLQRKRSESLDSSGSSGSGKAKMPLKVLKRSRSHDKLLQNSNATQNVEPCAYLPIKTGRKTNNSLASATGKIVIPDNNDPVHSNLKKLKTSQIFRQTEEDIQTDMYKVLEQLTAHDDAWPFIDPVEEEYAPNYYTVIRRPMDLRKMEERLDSGYYTDFTMFKSDFKLIVNNCRLYNGQDNEYTMMVDNLQHAFDRLTDKYMHRLSSSDEEIAVEYQLSIPRRQHKRKLIESSIKQKKKKRKSQLESGDGRKEEENKTLKHKETETKKIKVPHRNKEENIKKKPRRHYRHGKHSKILRQDSYKSGISDFKKYTINVEEAKKKKKILKKDKHYKQSVSVSASLKQSESQESLWSSNRSRSASPLPSPTEFDPPKLQDSDVFKDDFEKNERWQGDAKAAWESLFDHKQKTVDKTKQNLKISNKDKNQKLRETIEKLRAKSEKYKDSSLFQSQITSNHHNASNSSDTNIKESANNRGGDLDFFAFKNCSNKKNTHNNNEKINCAARNESASEALEQAVKDISKWLDDVPEGSAERSTGDRFAYIIATEGQDSSRQDEEFSKMERSLQARKDLTRKRLLSREPKMLFKRRDIHRTIDRLQPGKSKGNLLTVTLNKNTEKAEEVTVPGNFCKARRKGGKGEETSPKLSLGSVLETVEFSFGKDVKFLNNEHEPEGPKETPNKSSDFANCFASEDYLKKKNDVSRLKPYKKDAKIVTDPIRSVQPTQDNAMPNLSAWFKAFGSPKSTISVIISNKKTPEESKFCDKTAGNNINENKSSSQKITTKYDSLTDPERPNKDKGDSSLPNNTTTPRQRRTSTGSSISERSSFSQDLDSPRHQLSHTSPLLQSPTSPHIDDVQKISYPIINGTIRAGFYQDTTCIKSSPEKNCSPRRAPMSAFSPYLQHNHASNNAPTSYYFKEHNKSPLTTYFVNPPSCHDTTEAPAANMSDNTDEVYTSLGPDSYQHNECSPYSAPHSPHLQSHITNYCNQDQNSPQTTTSDTVSLVINMNATHTLINKKNVIPVKKRLYNENDLLAIKIKQENGINPKFDYQMTIPSLHTMSSFQATSVGDTKLESKKKSELVKLKSLRENSREYTDRYTFDNSKKTDYEVIAHDTRKLLDVNSNQTVGIATKDNVDMINMGYMNPDNDRRNNAEKNRDIYRKTHSFQTESYEVGSFAINHAIISQRIQKSIPKSNILSHANDRSTSESLTMTNVRHSQYESICSRQSSNFSLSDIELANKKIYGCNTVHSPAAQDYDTWKTGHQTRKQDVLPHDNFSSYNINADEFKSDTNSSANTSAINYDNKSIHDQQCNNFNDKTSLQRTRELQQNLQPELRIQTSRGLVQNDVNISCSISDSNFIGKNLKSKSQSNADKLDQNYRLIGSVPYKTSYSTHSPLQLNSMRNLPNIPQMLKRYTKDDRYISNLTGSSCTLSQDKNSQITQIFNKLMSSEVHPSSTSSIYPESATVVNKNDSKINKNNPNVAAAVGTKCKRKRTSDPKQIYQTPCSTDVLSSEKTSLMPGNSFGFSGSTNMALGGGLYADNSGFSIDDFRNSTTNQMMATNYMAAAVAHQQRNNVEANFVKLVKPAHQNRSHASSSFPFIGNSQVRAGYPFVAANPSSPLYQQYLQRHQEPFLGHTGAQIMSLYPPGFPTGLGGHQPYDTLNRPSWL